MEYLFNQWQAIVDQIKKVRQTILMLDFDGTLTPIVDTPEKAHLSDNARKLLQDIAGHRCFIVGVISGRAINDLRERVGVSNIIYVGNHGLEIEGPDFSFVHPVTREIKPVLYVIREVLERKLSAIPGVIIEDKGIDLSIHYRLVNDERVQEVRNIVEDTIAVLKIQGKVRMAQGKKVYEIRPNTAWDKGEAVNYIIRKYRKKTKRSGLLPVYVGDDLTDEDAFREINNHGGIAVYIGGENSKSLARYYLKTTDEVELLLERLLEVYKTINC